MVIMCEGGGHLKTGCGRVKEVAMCELGQV